MPKNPRIVVGVGDLTGCGYYRCTTPYKELAKHGFDVHLTNCLTYPSTTLAGINAIVFQRQHSPQVFQIGGLVQNDGGKVVVEMDDYFHDIPKNNPCAGSYPKGSEQVQYLERFMKMANLMTVSTTGLRDNYSKFNSNIHICPNQIDKLNYINSEVIPYNGGEFRLGWAGSSTHYDDLLTVVKPISEVMTEHREVKFVFIGHDYRSLFPRELHGRMEHAGHTFPVNNDKALMASEDDVSPVVKYYELLKNTGLHAAIAPILQVTFNRCKSAVKLMEYGLAGIPFVATNFGPYSQYVNNARPLNVGLVADRNPEWKRGLKMLITNEKARVSFAEANIQNLHQSHLLKSNINLWIKAFESIGILPGLNEGIYEENIVKSQ